MTTLATTTTHRGTSRETSMSHETVLTHAALRPRHRRSATDHRILYAICFVVFLLAAVLSRLWPGYWLQAATHPRRKSVLAEAREATCATIPYAFMG